MSALDDARAVLANTADLEPFAWDSTDARLLLAELAAECEQQRRLIDYAMHLHENGEGAPGHELATWDGWYRSVRALLEKVEPPE